MKNKLINTTLAVNAFNMVRDIPYKLDNPEKDSSCSSKAKLLGEILVRLGFSVKIMVALFDWRDLPLPTDMSIIGYQTFGISKHYFLSVKNANAKGWVNVDPTWDSALKNVFTITQWDGKTDTILAVQTDNIKPYEGTLGDLKFKNRLNNPFAIRFNSWLEEVRKKL